MEISDKIKKLIENKSAPEEIKQLAKTEGLSTLRENTVKKLLDGITTMDEVVRVTGII